MLHFDCIEIVAIRPGYAEAETQRSPKGRKRRSSRKSGQEQETAPECMKAIKANHQKMLERHPQGTS
ncbi:MAG: hypothetical protein Q4E72_04945 [bacterium]|nr:hypothetical protein [bacterium]